MKREDKELLLKDLCTRLPYGVKIELMPVTRGKCTTLTPVILHDYFISDDVNYLPYLRPMPSMTEEEKAEVSKLGVCYDGTFHNDIYDVGICMEEAFAAISWLLERHFDINYLIHKGLALEAPKGMYK